MQRKAERVGTRTTSLLYKGMLTYQYQEKSYTVAVGTPAWRNWLTNATTFTVVHECCTFTTRKERAGNGRGMWYWRAYYKHHGILHRIYIGKAEELTLARLDEIAMQLAEQSHSHSRAITLTTSERDPLLLQKPVSSLQTVARLKQQGKKYAPSRRHHPVLLTTKLSVPHIRSRAVARPRLYERLQQTTKHKLLLVSAPAGFGKTTLLSAWATTSHDAWFSDEELVLPRTAPRYTPLASLAWLSLDEGDNDPTSFWTYFIAALDTIQQGIGDTAQALLSSTQPVSIQTILSVLINALSTLTKDFVLMLDDYHVIETQAIHEALAYMLDHMPERMHLLIATRVDPALPLARWRAYHDLLELRMTDLCFTHEEATDFFRQTTGLTLSADTITTLETRTEGWIAGLQLAALSLQGQEDIPGFIASFVGTHRHILDYLAEEVFAYQSEQIRTFLLHTCILDRLNGLLCDALTGQSNGQDMLKLLEQNNLFVVSLDHQRTWYRYHHLFADVLRKYALQAFPEHLPALHLRASRWYEENGLTREAIEHALSAADVNRAATLVEQLADGSIWAYSEMVTLQRWLAPLPESVVRSRPQLCILQAWVLQYSLWFGAVERNTAHTTLEVVEAYLQDAQQQIVPDDENSKTMQGEIATLLSLLFFARGEVTRVKGPASLALDLLPQENTTLRCLAARMLYNLYSYYGDTTIIAQAMREFTSISQRAHDVLGILNALLNIAYFQTRQGELHQAARSHRRALICAEQQLQSVARASPHSIGLGSILLEWNDLEGAEHYLIQGIERLKERGDPGILSEGYHVLASLRLAQGDHDSALTALDDEEQVIRRSEQYAQYMSSKGPSANRAWLALLQGDLRVAKQWADTCKLPDEKQLTPSRTMELIILARIYLTNHEVEEAIQLLTRLLQEAEEMQHVNNIIQLLALQTLAFSAHGNEEQARRTLARAVVLAEPGSYITTFTREGAAMATLLLHVLEAMQTGAIVSTDTVSPKYIQTLRTALRPTVLLPSTSLKHAERTHPPRKEQEALLSVLSMREREIIRLMAQGHSDREIAQQLFLAESTIKTYAKRLYAKLGVKNRMQAVTCIGASRLL